MTDRLIWKYTSSAEMRPITLRLRRKGRTSEITLAPRKAKEVIQIAASCYPDLSEGDAASLYDSPLRDYKPLEWDDFPLFYEVLTPKVKKKDRVKPQSDDPKSSISDAWCPMVQARARN